MQFQRADGQALHVRGTTAAEADRRAIYEALGIAPDRLGMRRMVL